MQTTVIGPHIKSLKVFDTGELVAVAVGATGEIGIGVSRTTSLAAGTAVSQVLNPDSYFGWEVLHPRDTYGPTQTEAIAAIKRVSRYLERIGDDLLDRDATQLGHELSNIAHSMERESSEV